tara:strand:+ start:299 stop:556 length:258 start_codon:yes stop_codon:yes gene_type:complete
MTREKFEPVPQQASLSDVVVSSPEEGRDSLGEDKIQLNGFTNYQAQARRKFTNEQKQCCVFWGVVLWGLFGLFILILAIASRNLR